MIVEIGMDSLSAPAPGVMHDKRSEFNTAPEGSCKYCRMKTGMITEVSSLL